MEKHLASLHVPNKAEATLGAQALNSALHRDTSFLTWAVSPIALVVSRRVCAPTRDKPAAAMGDACVVISGLQTRLVGSTIMGA
jgi:hypothetical protein